MFSHFFTAINHVVVLIFAAITHVTLVYMELNHFEAIAIVEELTHELRSLLSSGHVFEALFQHMLSWAQLLASESACFLGHCDRAIELAAEAKPLLVQLNASPYRIRGVPDLLELKVRTHSSQAMAYLCKADTKQHQGEQDVVDNLCLRYGLNRSDYLHLPPQHYFHKLGTLLHSQCEPAGPDDFFVCGKMWRIIAPQKHVALLLR